MRDYIIATHRRCQNIHNKIENSVFDHPDNLASDEQVQNIDDKLDALQTSVEETDGKVEDLPSTIEIDDRFDEMNSQMDIWENYMERRIDLLENMLGRTQETLVDFQRSMEEKFERKLGFIPNVYHR